MDLAWTRLVPHVDLARGTEASRIARPAEVVSAGRLDRYTDRRYIRCRHRAPHQRCGPRGGDASCRAPAASGCRQGEQPAVTRPLAARLGQRGDRCGTLAEIETGGSRHSGISRAGDCGWELATPRRARRRAPGGPLPDGAVPARPRRRSPGRTRTSAPSRPLSRVPALRYRGLRL
jgi:hypothetical protein